MIPAVNHDYVPNADDGWFPGSKWVPLTREKKPINPVTVPNHYAPTEAHNSKASQKDRYNFIEIFDRPIFSAKSPVWERTSGKNKRLKMDGHGRPRYFSRARSKGRARLDWLENHKLNPDSNPVDFVNAMMKIDNSENGYTDTLFSKWTSWTNAKAILANMDRNSYGIIAPFTISEIIKHVALYILNGPRYLKNYLLYKILY